MFNAHPSKTEETCLSPSKKTLHEAISTITIPSKRDENSENSLDEPLSSFLMKVNEKQQEKRLKIREHIAASTTLRIDGGASFTQSSSPVAAALLSRISATAMGTTPKKS